MQERDMAIGQQSHQVNIDLNLLIQANKYSIVQHCLSILILSPLFWGILQSGHACERKNTENPNYIEQDVLCDDDISRLKVPKFHDYKSEKYVGKLNPTDFSSSPELKNWKTVISKGYTQGVNFAGKYTLISWGCGSGCVQNALVNAETGKVIRPPEIAMLISVETRFSPKGFAKLGLTNDAILNFYKDSSLIAVIGKLGEDSKKNGIYFFNWDGEKFRLISKIERNS
jgi:hypothetical protein